MAGFETEKDRLSKPRHIGGRNPIGSRIHNSIIRDRVDLNLLPLTDDADPLEGFLLSPDSEPPLEEEQKDK